MQNTAQLALEMGNSPGMIFRHYRELTTMAEARGWWGLDSSKGKTANAALQSSADIHNERA